MKLFELKDKVAIVTGSSRGIGRSLAEAYAAMGARVVVSSRKQEACDEVVDSINARYGKGLAVAIAANISDKRALKSLVDQTLAEFGKVDVLVCNAASNPYYGPMSGISDEQFRKVLDNNVLSNHWLAQMVSEGMIRRRSGSIIIVSSVGGFIGTDVIGAYNISKAADMQLVRNLAVEFGSSGIRANAISPGVIRTDFARALWEDPRGDATLQRAVPLGRIGEPDEIAGAAVYLASEASSYVTGQNMVIDGGLTIKGSL